jgi:hypothetical protein
MTRQTKTSNIVSERLELEEKFAVHYPRLYHLLNDREYLVTGLTAFIGDHNGMVVGLKRQDGLGKHEILWTSGIDLISALAELDRAIVTNRWREDKRLMDKSK